MMRLFLDASVLFAAALSPTGASREILLLALQGRCRVVLSSVVIEEVRRNLTRKAPEALPFFEAFLQTFPHDLIDPPEAEVRKAAAFVAFKDAPIVAAARHARVDALVSLDRQHLVGVPEAERAAGVEILLPVEALHRIRRGLRGNDTSL